MNLKKLVYQDELIRRIEMITNDKKTILTDRMAGFESFSMGLDESTDLSDTAERAIFIRESVSSGGPLLPPSLLFPFHQPILPSIRYPISIQEAGATLVTPLRLQRCEYSWVAVTTYFVVDRVLVCLKYYKKTIKASTLRNDPH
ncbi:hypothetical protein EVAR_81609_1 [Eumeta japonica]|uniref:Uncharacterized protein n=1 Tax=Eumeta variegata TaxID=151549 RepID=A0A4C1WF68_EUMVA|nr:hypothetical protein EVAR_81609_1 [Eumeta japonica]